MDYEGNTKENDSIFTIAASSFGIGVIGGLVLAGAGLMWLGLLVRRLFGG